METLNDVLNSDEFMVIRRRAAKASFMQAVEQSSAELSGQVEDCCGDVINAIVTAFINETKGIDYDPPLAVEWPLLVAVGATLLKLQDYRVAIEVTRGDRYVVTSLIITDLSRVKPLDHVWRSTLRKP